MYLSSFTWFQNKETFPWREPVPYVGVSLTSVVLEDCSAHCVALALSHVEERDQPCSEWSSWPIVFGKCMKLLNRGDSWYQTGNTVNEIAVKHNIHKQWNIRNKTQCNGEGVKQSVVKGGGRLKQGVVTGNAVECQIQN